MKIKTCNGASACIEVEERGGIVLIRNVGNTKTEVLCTLTEFREFRDAVKGGVFDAIGQGEREGAPLGELSPALSPVA